ncbi:hypothetical protein N7460_010030 [Penicillium canescens]|uniref:NB-ARC domain-containing protein n=1 Tax=Penicillium canescens TaxID=5083 RepID=A0AAD6I536_PENCN|nr:hypothetical protein N7460_010030 [Penicillium canescens]KAJ6042988.1 hypothetical protein N7444_008252 [Penicillium canescens]
MASAISFECSNSGFQMGVNHGSVTNHFHMPKERKEINPRPRDQPEAHYIIPSLENRHFTGREFTLDQLKQKLFLQANTGKLALFGLGGIGKTQVALQLARWVQAHIPDCSIFWAPALSIESFEQACSQIAKELQTHQNPDGESAMELVHRQLSSNKAGKWLFIVDNADDVDLLFDKLDQYFPASDKGVTLLTTRSREVALSFAGRDIVELQNMTTEEGIAFLTKIVGEDSLCDQSSTIQLLEELNFLPLAIAQAAHYICRNDATSTRYLELMRKTEKDRMRLASREFHDSTRYRRMPNAVTTTWLISFNQIQGSDPSAADLLGFISYLEPKAIPRSILPTLDSEEEMEFAIDKLFPSDEYTNRDTWRMYLPHALEILRREESQDHVLAGAYQSNGQIKQAVELLEHVVAVGERTLDEEHPDRLASQHVLAQAYESNGQIKQAVDLLEHVVAVRERTLDEEHPSRLASQHTLAWAYQSNGQIKQAVELLEHVVAVGERTLDEEHPDRLASQHVLAGAYKSNGQIKQAVDLLEHVVAVRERTLDEEHPSRLASQHTLAWAYKSNGQIKQAVELLEHVVAVEERTLDEEHPSRLASQHVLAWAYQSNGQIKQAVELLEHVVAVRERTLDEKHPDRLASQRALQGIKQSIKVAIMENIFSSSPPDIGS